MTDFLPQLSAFTVFIGLTVVGFLFLLVSLVFGEIFDHFDGGLDTDLDHGGPSFLSTRVLSVFVTGFGGAGAVATHYGFSMIASSGVGFVTGLAFATAIYFFARFLYGQQATTSVKSTDLAAQTGRVVVGIPAGGLGQVRCRIGEELIDTMARSGDGTPIAENTPVVIESMLGEVAVVRRVEPGSRAGQTQEKES